MRRFQIRLRETYSVRMDTLARPLLSDVERQVLERFVGALQAELGESLEAVWLYGSRARGEDTGWESDVDLMVVTAPPIRRYGKRIQDLIWEIAGPASFFSVQTEDTRSLAERRSIGDFFQREVDRDRIVVFGDPGASPPATRPSPGAMRRRTEEYLERVHERLRIAELTLEAEGWSTAVTLAYDAMFLAAGALLSEEDLHHRTHSGTWQLLREHFVLTGRFPVELYRAGASTQYLREASYYRPPRRFEGEEATRVVARAREFVAHAERLIITPL